MHGFVAFVVAFAFAIVLGVSALFVGYFAYRARRAKERLATAAPEVGPTAVDPLDEYVRLRREIAESVARAGETAVRMRDTVKRGVR